MKKKRFIFLLGFISLFGFRLLAAEFSQGCILITEIMENPEGSMAFPETKYIEIFNASDASINLEDWQLIADDRTIVLPEVVLAAGQYAVLYEGGNVIHVDEGGLAVPLSSFPSILTNLKIETPDGEESDAITCPAPMPARSWERDEEGNLYLSNDLRGGTPGSVNSPREPSPVIDDFSFGDIWINEIMVNPGSSLVFGDAEYIELYNATSSEINLKSWTLIYHASETSSTVIILPEILLPAGGYTVVYRANKTLNVDAGGMAIPVTNFPSTLANAGRLLEVKSPQNILIATVTYPNSTSFAGSSWERDSDGNYFLSNDPRGGTPGSVNSADNVRFGDIWINEIMVNPGPSLVFGDAEYVELYNASSSEINLKNWTFIYHASETSSTVVTLPYVNIPAGGYAVLYREGKHLDIDAGGIAIPVANFPSTLANTGRLIEIKNSKGILIDAVTYTNSTSLAGSSWERDGDGNYYPSSDPRGGTPGSANSSDNVRFGDIWINEIMVNPGNSLIFGDAEYVELYNASTAEINLRGWSFIYHATETSSTIVTLPDVLLPAGSYAVLFRTGKRLDIDAGGIAIPAANFPSTLANTGRLLEIKNPKGVLIDAANYPNSSALQGCSWERDVDDHFYPSADIRGGTPGSANSSDNVRFGDILINEIMVIPNGSTVSETEYVELFNTSSSDINLKGLTFIYDARTEVTLPGVILPVGGYAVLYRTDRNINIDAGGIPVPVANFPSTLANTGRLLELRNTRDMLIDSVTYKDATTIRGCSWERDIDGNFYPSNDPRGGTPGSANSIDDSRFGNVRINEIMVNPVGAAALPETEYVELYNTSTYAQNLRGWTFIYHASETSSTVVTLPGIILPVGGYAVVYRDGKDILIDKGGIAIPVANFPATLANTGRFVELRNSRNVLIDSVSYKNSTALAGCSWERDRYGNFYPSNDTRGGTPGSMNSSDDSRFGDVWINEIMVNPAGGIVLPETEYVELYNASDYSLNLRGWTFIYDSRTVVTLSGIILPVGGYAVLYRDGKDILIDKGGIAISVANFPATLANAGRLLELKNSRNILIDSITYKNSTNISGCSWERDWEGNFYLSNDPRGGTPGSVNSLDVSRYGDVWINEIMVNPGGAALPENEYVELYNTSVSSINLRGWMFIYHANETSSTIVTLPGVILPVGGYAVLYRDWREVVIDKGGIAVPVANFPATLANAGRFVELRNSRDILIDSITYRNSANVAGRSWERDREGDYYLSNDPRGGTPGSVNSLKTLPKEPDYSQYGDVIINEVMADPRGLTAFPETEYIELYNVSNDNIDLKGWTLIYDERVNIVLPDVILPAGGYAVLYRSSKEIHIDDGGNAVPLAAFPATLANAGRKLELTNSLDVLIDSITYKAAKSAQSWERDAAGNWYLTTDSRGGTPGSVNSPKEPVIEPDDAKYGDVWINEIMADPRGLTAFPETEYIELYNASMVIINLKGWTFIYDERVNIVLPDIVLPADSYAVLYRTGKEIHIDDGGIAIPLTTFPATLANTGRHLGLTNQKGTLIDSISYPAVQQAWAYERDSDGSLYLSYNLRGGTPGSINSFRSNPEDPNEASLFISEKEWIFNELLPEEFIGGSEYIELYNRSNRTIYLSGLSISTRRADGTLGTRYALSSIKESFQPGEYVVLTTNRAGVLDFYYTPTPQQIYEVRLPTLNNSGATLVLFRTTEEIVIDEVSYTSKWHDQFMRNLKGVALERINPDVDTQNQANWTSATSTVGYGTPGYKNSQHRDSDTNETIHVSSPAYMDGFGHYTISYRMDKNGYRCRMEVYALEGKKVANISNNQLLGFEGEVHWDGYGVDGSRLRAGLYIFYVELYHPDGQRKNLKNVFLVKP